MGWIQPWHGNHVSGNGSRYQKGLVGGFIPFEKYSSKRESPPSRDEHKKYLKPPPRGLWKWNLGLFFLPHKGNVA